MDLKKSNVVKSKSSNSAIPNKNERFTGKKKTCSSVEVQPTIIKKRGVYVEKKSYKMGRSSPVQSTRKLDSPNQTKTESPVRGSPPRRDRNKFLTSVLNILSQNTTSTQYPEETEETNRKSTSKDVFKKTVQKARRRVSSPIPTMLNQKQEAKKPKYKSKTLNNNPNEIDQFIVWKKSNIKPSLDSASSISCNKLRIRCDDETDCSSSISKHIAEGKQLRSTKIQQRMNFEPDTLASQSKMKDDKCGIYDFFVDFLETTLNVYNVNAEVDVEVKQSEDSNVKLEIDETIATKLKDIVNNVKNKPSNINKMFRTADEFSDETKSFMRSVMDSTEGSENIDLADDYVPIRSRSPLDQRINIRSKVSPTSFRSSKSAAAKCRASKLGKPVYSKSFSYPEKYKANSQKTQSVISNASKKNDKKRKTLLGMLKEELSFNDYVYDEPQNLFEALKIMARNKKRAKSIRFADNDVKPNDCTRADCMKSEKVIPASLKSRNKRANDYNQTCGAKKSFNRLTSKYKCKIESKYLGDTESCRSLEVYDFNYEFYEAGIRSPSPTKPNTKKRLIKKNVLYTAPSDLSTHVGYLRETEDSDGTIRKFAKTIVGTIDHRKANDNISSVVNRYID